MTLVLFLLTTQIQTKNKPAGIFEIRLDPKIIFQQKFYFQKINLDNNESIKLYFVSIKAIKI